MERATKNIVPKVSLPDTMRVIMNLLDTLAGAKFTGTVDTDAVKIRLPVERVSRAVREVDPDTLHLEFWKSIGGLLQDLGNTILNWFGMGVERDDILDRKSVV